MRTTGALNVFTFCAGIGVESTGHCHPRVVKAIQEQAALLIHSQQNIFTSNVAQVLSLYNKSSPTSCPSPRVLPAGASPSWVYQVQVTFR